MWCRKLAEAVDGFFARHMLRIERGPSALDLEGLKRFLSSLPVEDPQQFYAPPRFPRILPPFASVKGLRAFRFPTPLPTSWPENNVVYGLVRKRSLGRTLPTMILLHGWQEQAMLYTHFMGLLFAKAGIDVALLELPYHNHRRPTGAFNGQYMLSADLVRTVQALRQAVMEVQCIAAWVRDGTERPVGLFGTSLGGLVAALTSVASDRIDFAVLNTPAVDLVGSVVDSGLWWDQFAYLKHTGEAFQEELRRTLAIVTPARLRPRIPKSRILILEAACDRFVPQPLTQELWEQWGRPPRRQFPQGHMSHYVADIVDVYLTTVQFVRRLDCECMAIPR